MESKKPHPSSASLTMISLASRPLGRHVDELSKTTFGHMVSRETRERLGRAACPTAPRPARAGAEFSKIGDIVEAACDEGSSEAWTGAMASLAAYALTQDLPCVAAAQILDAHSVYVEELDWESLFALFAPLRADAMARGGAALLPFDQAREFAVAEDAMIERWETAWAVVEARAEGPGLAPR